MKFPAPVPEIPVADLDKAIAYYVNVLGFACDWRNEKDGIAGVSREHCRLFIASSSLRELYGKVCPILFLAESRQPG
jgi:catechol 2,3-dioxygenase-like lactoylglutathione lyase family enzyme